jgi:hypothetical protein
LGSIHRVIQREQWKVDLEVGRPRKRAAWVNSYTIFTPA